MKLTIVLTILLLSINSCSLIEDKLLGPQEDLIELYETDSEEFPLLVIDEAGTQFVFSQDLKSLYLEFANADQWMMQFGADGLPSDLLIKHDNEEYLVQFGPFNGDLSSIVIVDQNTDKKTFVYDVEFEGVSEAASSFFQDSFSQKNLRTEATTTDFSSWYESNKATIFKIGGPAMTAISLGLCGVSVKAAIVTGGILTAIAVVNCGSFAASFASSNIKNHGVAIVVKAGTLPGKFAEAVLKCAFIGKVDCIKASAGAAVAFVSFFSTAKKRNVNIEADKTLAAFVATGGLAGTWEAETELEGTNNKQSYSFGLNGGFATVETLLQTSEIEVMVTARIGFIYTLLTNEKLNMNFQRIIITSRIANLQDGTTKQEQIGPISWDDFLSMYEQAGYNLPPNAGITVYELSEDKTELTLKFVTNSLTLKRKEETDLFIENNFTTPLQ